MARIVSNFMLCMVLCAVIAFAANTYNTASNYQPASNYNTANYNRAGTASNYRTSAPINTAQASRNQVSYNSANNLRTTSNPRNNYNRGTTNFNSGANTASNYRASAPINTAQGSRNQINYNSAKNLRTTTNPRNNYNRGTTNYNAVNNYNTANKVNKNQYTQPPKYNAANNYKPPVTQKAPIKYVKPTPKPRTPSASCREKNARYPVSGQCDAYIECIDGFAEERLCPDGLLFNDKSNQSYPCGYPNEVKCEQRSGTQAAQATQDCPHQFGYYRLGDASHCGTYKNCAGGIGYTFECPEGLAFNLDTYQCDWPDLVHDCNAEAFLGFKCPVPPKSDLGPPADPQFHPSPSDCASYFLCLDGHPRLNVCPPGQGYNHEIRSCDDVENFSCSAPLKDRSTPPPERSALPQSSVTQAPISQKEIHRTRQKAANKSGAYVHQQAGAYKPKPGHG